MATILQMAPIALALRTQFVAVDISLSKRTEQCRFRGEADIQRRDINSLGRGWTQTGYQPSQNYLAASLATPAKAPKGCQQTLKVDRLRIKFVTTRRKCLFALAGQRMRGQSDDRDVARLRVALQAPQTYWELSFINEDGGRQTRLEVTSGSFPSELALARACAA